MLQARAQDSRTEQTVPLKIYFDQKVKMRDGIALSADVFGPTAPAGFLNRTPYLKSSAGTAEFAEGNQRRRDATWPLERRYLDCLENCNVFVVP